jgi:hypothetical protein
MIQSRRSHPQGLAELSRDPEASQDHEAGQVPWFHEAEQGVCWCKDRICVPCDKDIRK